LFLGRDVKKKSSAPTGIEVFLEAAKLREEALLYRECGWPDNNSNANLLAWCWKMGGLHSVTVVNSDFASQGLVRLAWGDLSSGVWKLSDDINRQVYERHDGDALSTSGLYVSLPPWGYHFMRLEQAGAAREDRRAAA
jgi:hypothetical protein